MAFVSGPRQCGKTTLGKMLLKNRGIGEYFNWDETEFRRLWTKSPKSVFPSDRTEKSGQIIPLLVLDEIHKAKKWKQTLKGVYDTMDLPADILVTIDFLIVKDKKPWLPVEAKESDLKPSPNFKRFLPHLKCPLALQVIKQPNYRSRRQIGDATLLVASFSRILPFFV